MWWALARQPRRCSGACGLSCGLSPSALNALVSPYGAILARARFGTASPPLAARHLPCSAPRPPPRTGRRSAPLRLSRFARLRSARPRGRGSDGAVACAPSPSVFVRLRRATQCGSAVRPFRGARTRGGCSAPLRARVLRASRSARCVLRSAPSARALWNSSTTNAGLRARGSSAIGAALARLRRCLPLKGGRPRVPFAPLARPFGALRVPCLFGFRLLCWAGCLAGVSNGAPRLTDTPARLARERAFILTLSLRYPYVI